MAERNKLNRKRRDERTAGNPTSETRPEEVKGKTTKKAKPTRDKGTKGGETGLTEIGKNHEARRGQKEKKRDSSLLPAVSRPLAKHQHAHGNQ